MSKSALSAKVFALYLFVIGAVVVAAPNFLLSILRIPETSEVWIRLLGMIAFNMGVYAWVCASHTPFLAVSIYTRSAFFICVATLAALGLASPMIILFAVPDLLGAIWTHLALKAEDGTAAPELASQG